MAINRQNRNDRLLSDFLKYCVKHPYQTFHQALRSWERERACSGEQAGQGPTNPSEYYRQKQDEADSWIKLRDYALVRAMPSPVLRQLERHIEAARYVGD